MTANIPNKTALFNPLSGHLEQLFGYIDLGDLGLPDLQRPFVWSNSKVRDLFDSIYRGYPIGSYLLWRNSSLNAKSHHIGTEKKEHTEPNLLKIILAVVIFLLIIAFPTYGEICPVCDICLPDNPNCCPCSNGLKFFSGFYLLGSIFHVESLLTLVFMLITTMIFSYILSCSIIYTYNKVKK